VLRRNFGACVQPLMAVEKVLMMVPMGSSARRDLAQARRVLADRLYLLEVERETNPTVAAFVEAKRSKGDERDFAAAVDKYAKIKKSEKQASGTTGGGGDSARGARNRAGYNAQVRRAPAFPVYLPTPTAPAAGYQRAAPRPGVCFDCLEPGHRRGDASCKKKN
jgi:pyruvate/2-oxoglutarate dehydrogenase complex dihydrolipoamide acyltransferase (E2) component